MIVSLKMIKNTLRLTISDNGKGFNMKQYNSSEERGWGLLTIHQRAEAIGGRSRIESSADNGTQVIIEVDR